MSFTNKKILLGFLEKQKKDHLIELLETAYDNMTIKQRKFVFSDLSKISTSPVSGEKIFKEVEKYYQDSLNKAYYAPFDMNSKNYSYIPEKTEEWFDILGELLLKAAQLTKEKKHEFAINCFTLLYELIDRMEDAEEIIFAHEFGSWMIPGDQKEYLEAYLNSLAAINNPNEFANKVVLLIKRDGNRSFANRVYLFATKAASNKQKIILNRIIKQKGIKVN